jgi:hypothetical protein
VDGPGKTAGAGVNFKADLAEFRGHLAGSGNCQTPLTVFDLAGQVAYDHRDISATCAGTDNAVRAV